jgi:hypothetical protein
MSTTELAQLADELEALAHRILAPMACTTPAYGAPGRAHCAACCYGTGLVVTCAEDQQLVDTATAMQAAARLLRPEPQRRTAEPDPDPNPPELAPRHGRLPEGPGEW